MFSRPRGHSSADCKFPIHSIFISKTGNSTGDFPPSQNSGSEAGAAAAVLFEFFQIECFVFGVSLESTIDRVTRIADGDDPNQRIDDEIDQSRDDKGSHRVDGLAVVKEICAEEDSNGDDPNSDLSIEILLNIQILMAARDAGCHDVGALQRSRHA